MLVYADLELLHLAFDKLTSATVSVGVPDSKKLCIIPSLPDAPTNSVKVLGRHFSQVAQPSKLVYLGQHEQMLSKFIVPNIGTDLEIIHVNPLDASATTVEKRQVNRLLTQRYSNLELV